MYQKKRKGFISWLLVFVMFCANMLPVFAQSLQGGDQPNQSIKLHFNKPADWQEGVNIHYWGRISSDGTKDKEDKTEWPGNVVEKDGDWYTYTFEDTSYVNVIFNENNENDRKQTANLEEITSQIFVEGWVVDNKVYSFNPETEIENNEITVNVQKPAKWESIYLQGNADIQNKESQAITIDLDAGEVWHTQTLETTGPAIEFKIVDTADIDSEVAKKIAPKGTKDSTFMTTAKEVWITADGTMHLSEPGIAEEPEKPEESEVERVAPTVVKFHYSREDGDYEGWNIWTWAEGKDGNQVDFIGEDENGAYAIISIPEIADKVGFIVRKGNWEVQEGGDRYIDTSKGNQEVFVTSGDSNFVSGPIQYNYEDVKVTVNYTRRDNNYDGWNLWMWPQDGDGGEIQFTQDSEDGIIATPQFSQMTGKSKIGLIVRKSVEGNDWAEKDGGDRFIDLTYANAKGEITVYLMQGDSNVYYGKVTPSITNAQLMDDFSSVEFALNIPLEDTSTVKLTKTGSNDEVEFTVTMNDDGITGTITTTEELNIAIPYTVSIEGYGELAVGLNNIYSTEKFEELYTYKGDLGALYTPSKTEFKLWAPTATNVKVKLYDSSSAESARATYDMLSGEQGTWSYEASGDLHGTYYTYEVTVAGKTVEAVDPYAKTTGTNGKRGMVIDLASTNPTDWQLNDHKTVSNQTDAIIYELHVRDLSMHPDSGIKNKGKFTGLIETGTTHKDGTSTGLDHIKDLGVTHVHLLPVYDYLSVDESKIDTPQFNWGYDPVNYNVPEGFYSTDPTKGEVRVNEFKQMVKGLHDNDLGVIMDVVYNHLGGDAAQSNFDLIVPGYYFRMNAKGEFSDGAGCGNETASERSMMRKFMVDSVTYWAKEYNVDGFRFDLMGLHDITTMNLIREELDKINPQIIMYGEGWTGGDTPLPESDRALKKNVPELNDRIAAFSDDLRDGLKGSVFEKTDVAFINGNAKDAKKAAESIKFGVVASTEHPQVDYSKINYSKAPWANEPTQTVSYVSAHDNHTLWDKIQISAPDATEFEQIRMDKFAAAIVLTSQGMPFLHAGEEMLRTKGGDENSYKSPDSVNQFDWARKDEHKEVFEYYKGLIKLRKDHPAFRMSTTEQIAQNLTFLEMPHDSMVGYEITGASAKDDWAKIVVIHNGSKQFQSVELEGEDWISVVDSEKAGVTGLARYEGNTVQVTPNSTHVFVDKVSYDKTAPIVEDQDITIYVEKPEDWEAPYIWYAKDGDWQTDKLGEEPSKMKAVDGRQGWYKKEIKAAKRVAFLFNNGTWDKKIAQQGTGKNFEVMTKAVWVTADGKLYSHDPVDYADKEDEGDEDDDEGPPKFDPDKDLAIHFRKPADWPQAYIHTWGALGNTDWPGNKLVPAKDVNGKDTEWYVYVFKGSKGKMAQFVLTKGPDGPQSSDLSTNKTCWIDESFKIYDYEPSMTISVETDNQNTYINYFKDEAAVKINYAGKNIEKAAYTLDGTDPLKDNGIDFENNGVITFGKGIKVGETITLTVAIDNGDMCLTNEYIYTKMEDVVIDKTAFNELRTYQIMVAPYRDGDKDKGHGIGYGPSHHHGDLKGITEALPYIKELGMNSIWLTPIFESAPIEGQSEAATRLDSTGYFTTNYFKIDPNFGTLEEAKELVKQAHDMGIYIFLDGVFGHHKAGVEIPASPSGHKITPGKGAEANNPVHFDEETLNFFKEVATYWMDELEIDGWRLDQSYQVSAPMQDDNYWRQIREAVEAKAKERKDNGHKWGTLGYMVGEDWSEADVIQERAYGPDFAPGLHSAYHFPGRYKIVQVLAGQEHTDQGRDNQPAKALNEVFDSQKLYANHAIPNLMLGNHDLLRFGDLIQRAKHLGYGKENPDYWKRHKAAISFLASYTGPITLFYGEEIGMECEGYVNSGDKIEGHVVADDNISRMPGRLPTDGDGYSKDEQDLHDYTQKIMKLRGENPALWNGERTHLLSTDTKYADLKQDGENAVVYLLNTGTQKETFQLDEVKVGATVLIDAITGEEIKAVEGKYTVPVEALTARFLVAKAKSSDTDTDEPNTNTGSGSNQGTSKPAEVPSNLVSNLDGLSKEGADVATSLAKVVKDINQLDSAQAKAQAGSIIASMADIIAKEKELTSIKELQDAMVTLAESLISRVTTQEVAIKDGKAILSASNIKEQLKDAEAIMQQLNQAVEKNKIQLTKSVKTTLNFEMDKKEKEVVVSIPESIWKAIDKKANVAIKTKGAELILEHDTFNNQEYVITVKQDGNVIDLTTDATFKKPMTVIFEVDQSVKNYPTVYQVIGDKHVVVGGLYNAETGTIKSVLSHFSLYTVKESSPKVFDDLKDITWQREAINELSARGYIAGMSETVFAPSANITRAEFAAMLTRVVPTLAEVKNVGFSDVKEGTWYYNSVATAVCEGWLVGRDDNKFDPTAPITRQEVAAVLSRILVQKGYIQTLNGPEGLNSALWAKDAVSLYLREVKIEELLKLDMSENATRAEVAAMIFNLIQY